MRKITALLLCVLLMTVCSVTAFAETVGIDTVVPDSHTVMINVTGDASATLDGKEGSTFTVERLGEPVLRFIPADGKLITKVTLNGEDITDKLVDGAYTLSSVYKDKILNIQAETTDFLEDDVRWAKGGAEGAVITVKLSQAYGALFTHFVGVELDGKALTEGVDYTVNKDDMTVTLSPELLEKLSNGEHTVKVVFDNGEFNTTLTVKAANSDDPTSPQTGDNSHIALWIALMVISFCGLSATLVIGKNKRIFGR